MLQYVCGSPMLQPKLGNTEEIVSPRRIPIGLRTGPKSSLYINKQVLHQNKNNLKILAFLRIGSESNTSLPSPLFRPKATPQRKKLFVTQSKKV